MREPVQWHVLVAVGWEELATVEQHGYAQCHHHAPLSTQLLSAVHPVVLYTHAAQHCLTASRRAVCALSAVATNHLDLAASPLSAATCSTCSTYDGDSAAVARSKRAVRGLPASGIGCVEAIELVRSGQSTVSCGGTRCVWPANVTHGALAARGWD
jgi:hypothetical protein